jgi:signal transduction histidine kinase
MFDAVAESMDVRLTVGELAPAVVHGDETYLRQVVRNLIDNAIKYNKHPGSVHVRLCVDPSGKYALFMVEDSGIGIDREVLPRIFERFYRADRSRSREKELGGYGLGLSICQTIAQALGGDIRVESETGRGSIFTVRLPLALADPGVKGPDAPARSLERVGLD